jgi:hypothetical protein
MRLARRAVFPVTALPTWTSGTGRDFVCRTRVHDVSEVSRPTQRDLSPPPTIPLILLSSWRAAARPILVGGGDQRSSAAPPTVVHSSPAGGPWKIPPPGLVLGSSGEI